MPVYNPGEILRDTIDSIISQTFTDFELILIDDGCKDVSPAICDEYAEHDRRIRVIHQKNGGICKARNAGIAIAQGEYLTFCDHDDIYLPKKLEVQYHLAEEIGADIVQVGYKGIRDNGSEYIYAQNLSCLGRKDMKKHLLDVLSVAGFGLVWNKLYRMETLKQYMQFNPVYTRGHEDINFNYCVMSYATSFVSTDEVLYHHIIRGSLSTSAKIHPELIVGLVDTITNYNHCVETYGVDLQKNANQYLRTLAEELRTLCVYLPKAGFSYEEFRKQVIKAESLISVKGSSLKGAPLKDALILALCSKKWYRLCYLVVKAFLLIK